MTQNSAMPALAAPAEPMTAEQRTRFDRDGYLIVQARLAPDEVTAARDALDRVYATQAKAGSLPPDGSMHVLSAVANCPEVLGLIDHPATFGYVWSVLGWNIPTSTTRISTFIHDSTATCRSGLTGTKPAAGRTARSRRPRARGYR